MVGITFWSRHGVLEGATGGYIRRLNIPPSHDIRVTTYAGFVAHLSNRIYTVHMSSANLGLVKNKSLQTTSRRHAV